MAFVTIFFLLETLDTCSVCLGFRNGRSKDMRIIFLGDVVCVSWFLEMEEVKIYNIPW